MNVSVVATVCNEEQSIKALLDSLLKQSLNPSEIVIVDGGSTDKTVQIIQDYQKKNKLINLIIDPGTISHGRNVAIKNAKYSIIAQTDAGCVADKNWLKKLIHHFANPSVKVVAGFYQMLTNTPFERALAAFVGVHKKRFDPRVFLPSGRSVAFRKSVWKEVGGYSEKLQRAGEDTLFNYLVVKKGIEIVREPNAIVNWQVPENLSQAVKKFFSYSFGDAQAKIWWHPSQRLATHNIKITLLFARYVLGLIFFNLAFVERIFGLILVVGFVLYLFWSIWKMNDIVTDWRAKLWLPVIQIASDIAVLSGFIAGTIVAWGTPKSR